MASSTPPSSKSTRDESITSSMICEYTVPTCWFDILECLVEVMISWLFSRQGLGGLALLDPKDDNLRAVSIWRAQKSSLFLWWQSNSPSSASLCFTRLEMRRLAFVSRRQMAR